MKTNLIALLTTALIGSLNFIHAQEPPKMPPPQKEHEWLQQFVGEWDCETEIYMEPGKPPLKCKATENVRTLSGFWVVSDFKGEMMGNSFNAVLTLGYDPEQKSYVGTWVDSMSSHLWTYTGSVDATGKILTLEAKGPCPMKPGQLLNFKEVTEWKSKDHRVFTSSIQDENGKWTTSLKMEARRKK